MGKDDDDFDQLIASLGAVLALTDHGQSLSNGLKIPYAIDVAAIRNLGCHQRGTLTLGVSF
jgi:putative transcriptional regulator